MDTLGHADAPAACIVMESSGRAGRVKSGKIQILRRNGSSGQKMTKIQLILRNIVQHTELFYSQDKYSAVRGSKNVFRPHCASTAHRPRAPARVDRRRTCGKVTLCR